MDNSKIAEFRKKFVKKLSEDDLASDVDVKDIHRLKASNKYVLCFIHWRRGDVDAAVKMAVLVLQWRKKNNISGLTAEEVNNELLKQGIVYVHGRALDGSRVVYFIGRRQTKEIKLEVQRILCLWLERLHQQETGKHVTFVLDVSKTGMSNVDLGGIRFLMDCFITYFPDMLERIIILEMPWIMNAIWKVVKQWMTEEQRKRTAFVTFKDLNQYIAPDNVLSYMGGEDKWEYEYPQPAGTIPCLSEIPNYEEDEISLQDEEECAMNSVEISVAETETKEVTEEVMGGVPENELIHRRKGAESSSSNQLLNVSRPLANGLVRNISEEKVALASDSTSSLNSTTKAPIPGINLHELLVLSPVAEIAFDEKTKDQKTGKYQSFFTLTNPNEAGQVAYKIKTNFPDRYHVKPSNGCVDAGESVKIRLNLSTGYEEMLSKDRFLILFAEKNDENPLVDFWKSHTSKDQHHEYRLRVKFNSSATSKSPATPSKELIPPLQNVSISELKTSTTADVEVETSKKSLEAIKKRLTMVENNTNCLQTKLHYSLGLNCILLLCIFYAIHQLSLVTVLLHFDQTSKNL